MYGSHGKGDDTCHENLDIRIRKCTDYFVYQLKPTLSDGTVYCTAADSALGDPCVTHTILDQPWRSMDCSRTKCSNEKYMNDKSSTEGWYRFKSSGGWRIPETAVPVHRCFRLSPGWLNDPASASTQDLMEKAAPEPRESLCMIPTPTTSTDSGSTPTREQKGTEHETAENLATIPSPDTETSTREHPKVSTGEPTQERSSVPAGDTSSDPEIYTEDQLKRSSTGDPTQESSSVPAGDTPSDLQISKGEDHKGSPTPAPTQDSSPAPKGETCSVKGLPTVEECEKMIREAQVLYIGQNNQEISEEMKEHLRKVLMEQLPCKYVLSNAKGEQWRKHKKRERN
ncbi:uncharacterized protein LOC127566808 [Pristis pectinata]|uniref:uncharacterized protein LOC127566808 n=1 Tax=Pristis pectinata TaxID=685728 RepID=UPI00223D53C2|nr:uncharacterized protein LOC127566808 [Pristis pectinata]